MVVESMMVVGCAVHACGACCVVTCLPPLSKTCSPTFFCLKCIDCQSSISLIKKDELDLYKKWKLFRFPVFLRNNSGTSGNGKQDMVLCVVS